MVEVEAKLLQELEDIDFHFESMDNTDGFAIVSGYKRPIVKVANTALDAGQLQQFRLDIGNVKVPQLACSILDNNLSFRTTDCIEQGTLLTIFVGSIRCEQLPTKLCMKVVDCQVVANMISITAELNLPTDKIAVQSDTMQAMLEDFCEKTGLGLRLCAPDFEQQQIANNYFDISPIDFLNKFCADLGFEWHIDNHYNVCINTLPNLIAEHEDMQKTCSFETYEDYDEPLPAKISDLQTENPIAIKFLPGDFGYDVIDVDNTVPKHAIAEFDKTFDTADTGILYAEDAIEKPEPLDLSQLAITLTNDPLLLYDRTYDIQLYTDANNYRKQSYEDFSANTQASNEQILIADMSGIYRLSAMTYLYPGTNNGFDCLCTFSRPLDNATEQ